MAAPTNKERAAARLELWRREAQRGSLWAFCLYYDPLFFMARASVLKPMADAMQRAWELRRQGRSYKVAISVPPRTGKSYLATLACCFIIGQEPQGSVMRNTADATLYMKMSRLALNVMRSNKFRSVFPDVRLKDGFQNIESWAVESARTVSYFGAGVGGRIVGEGCSLAAFTDDLFTNWASAASANERDRVYDWMLADHDSRIEGSACRIDIGTRWSPDDVIGRLSAVSYYDEIICIPAITETGDSYCEKIIGIDALIEKKRLLSPEIWEAEWMQNPKVAAGLFFPIDALNFMDLSDLCELNTLFSFATIDPADRGGDYFATTYCDVVEWDKALRIVVRDIVFTKDGLQVACADTIERFRTNHTEVAFLESNGIGTAAYVLLNGASNTAIKPYSTSAQKMVRILSNYEFIKNYYIFDAMYKNNSHYAAFVQNLCSLTKDGKNSNDDSGDALAASAEVVKAKYGDLIYGMVG